MGKASKQKKAKGKGKDKPRRVGPGYFEGPGDLRAVRYHLEQWRKHGVEQAHNMLLMLGRDASFTVCEVAEEEKDEQLLEFGRRLVAVRPQLDTNLLELRKLSVLAHVEQAKADATPAVEAVGLEVRGGSFAVFDPVRVLDALVHGGRPRKDNERVGAGDLAWFGVREVAPTAVRFTVDGPPVGGALRLRLRVESGVVFTGAPEASDGPRLGTVRLDPHRTQLDAHLQTGRFLRIKPGVYRIDAAETAEGVLVHLGPEPDPDVLLAIDVKRLLLR